jgi:hypothetical protein
MAASGGEVGLRILFIYIATNFKNYSEFYGILFVHICLYISLMRYSWIDSQYCWLICLLAYYVMPYCITANSMVIRWTVLFVQNCPCGNYKLRHDFSVNRNWYPMENRYRDGFDVYRRSEVDIKSTGYRFSIGYQLRFTEKSCRNIFVP